MSLEVRHIRKSYGSQLALADLNFNLQPNKILGFLGPNGAGKSTALKIIAGYMAADEGQIFLNQCPFNGVDIELKSKIGYLPESNPLYPDMYISEYLDFIAELYQIRDSQNTIKTLLTDIGLNAQLNKKIGQLSKGYQQRVGLCQALISKPELLLLDEATNGLDPNQVIEIRNLIKQYAAGSMVIFSTHLLEEVESLCDEVLILVDGKVKLHAGLEELKIKTPEKTLGEIFKVITSA